MVRPWRVARSLLVLRAEIDQAWPKRSKLSDGTIGDAEHAARTSDHNPFIIVDGIGVVRAFDCTHDPSGGPDVGELFEHIKDDPRVRYLIFNRRIWNASIATRWRPYSGSNPHEKHGHVSVSLTGSKFDDGSPWGVAPDRTGEYRMFFCELGDKGEGVEYLQIRLRALGFYTGRIDSDYGPKTSAAVLAMRKSEGSGVDSGDKFTGWAAWQLQKAERKTVTA